MRTTPWICTPGVSPADDFETSWFGTPSESSHPSDKDNVMVPPDGHRPENPSAKPTWLPHGPDRTAALARSPSWHQLVAQQHQLDRDKCRVEENDGAGHEVKQVAEGPNPEEKRKLLATPEGSETYQAHYSASSGCTPPLDVDPISTHVSDITPHLNSPPSIPIERTDSPHLYCRPEPSPAHLCDASGSQGQVTPELLPDPSLPLGRMGLSIGSRHQAHADTVTEVSASSDICNRGPVLSRRKRLRNCQRRPSEKCKVSEVNPSDLDSDDMEVDANDSENDNCPDVFTDADSGSYNDPGSPKTASHNW